MDGDALKIPLFRQSALLHFTLLAVLTSALFLSQLSCPLLEPEEARYAEIPRQMLVEGRFIEPVLHGEAYYQKPPLMYWLVMLSYSIFGVQDWAARLVVSLASMGTVLVVWLWARRTLGEQLALWTAIILILSGRFVYLGRMLTLDPLLSLWVTGGLAAAHLAIFDGHLRWRWWITSALMAGLGLLTKGPVALALILPPVLFFQVLTRGFDRRQVSAVACYCVLALAVASPWYVAMALSNPEAAADFWWVHNVQRFVDPLDHEEPWWFFLPSVFLGTLPWSLAAIPVAAWMIRSRPKPASVRPASVFALLAFAWCMLFFSMSGCKRAVYILPAFPWLAVCLACCISSPVWSELRWAVGPRGLRLTAAAVFAVLLVGVHVLLPRYHQHFGLRDQVLPFVNTQGEVFCYPKRWDSISFYLQRDDVRVFEQNQLSELIAALRDRPGAIVFVRDRNHEEFLRELPSTLEFVEAARPNQRLTVGVVKPRLVVSVRGE